MRQLILPKNLKNPLKSLPKALIGGTVLVTVLYTLLQYVFLKHVPIDYLAGQLNVGTIATQQMLGEKVGNFFGLAISLLLISGISAMVWVGPRVTSSIAKEHKLWRYFQTQENGIPKRALWLQFSISASLLLTGTFEQIMIYCGILLTASSLMTVLGVFKLRKQNQQRIGFKSPLFPLFQIVFILLSVWMIVYALINNPLESALGMSNLLIGTGTYFWSKKLKKPNY